MAIFAADPADDRLCLLQRNLLCVGIFVVCADIEHIFSLRSCFKGQHQQDFYKEGAE